MKLQSEKLKRSVLEKWLGHYEIEFKVTDDNLEDAAEVLLARYRALKKEPAGIKLKFAQCDECDGISDMALDECPYCGDTEPAVSDGLVVKKKVTKKKVTKKKVTPPSDDGPEVTAPKGRKKVTKKVASKKVTKKKATDIEGAVPAEIVTESMLDEQCTIIRTSGIRAAVELWELGHAWSRIQDQGLWKLRLGPDGKTPAHTNFKRFCTDEFGVSYSYVNVLQRGAEKFTKEEVSTLGFTAMRAQLQGDNDDGTETQTPRETATPTPTERVPSPNRITIAVAQGTMEAPAYKMPTAGVKNSPLVPATRIQDDPYSVMELENDVSLHIRATVNAEAQVTFIAEFKRTK